MFRFVFRAVALVVLYALMISMSFAASGDVTIPYGDWIVAALPILAFVLLILAGLLIAFGLRFLPAWAQAALTPALQAQLIPLAGNAINWGVQATTDAVKGKEVSVNVGSQIVAAAVQEFLDTAPQSAIDKLGGVPGVKKWIIAQLEDHGVIVPAFSNAQQMLDHPAVIAVKNPQ